MGCCINYFIGFENADTVDHVLTIIANHAVTMGFAITKCEITPRRKTLVIEPHKNSEWLCLDFMTIGDWAKSKEYVYCGDEIHGKNWDDWRTQRCPFLRKHLWYCAGFTKTEYTPKSIHAKVCELLRLMSPRASLLCIRDEANVYETRSKDNLLNGHGYVAGQKGNDISEQGGESDEMGA
jgi:hypothetical protein